MHKKDKNIYIFSGLGADERVFQNLDFSDYNIQFIEWIPPHKHQSIEDYAKRITLQISHPTPIFFGLSFGSIMAIKVAKQIKTEKVILIVSIKNRGELPFYYRLFGKLNIHRLLPSSILKSPNIPTCYLLVAYNPSDRAILKQILLETDFSFLKWAINCIVKWKNVTITDIYIHGTKDKILPFYSVKSNYSILDRGYLMTLSHPKEIVDILREVL